MWEELRHAREERRLSLDDLGSLAGMPGPTLCAWENEMPRQIVRAIELCKALDVSPNELFGWKVKKEKAKPDELKQGSVVEGKEDRFTEDELILFLSLAKKESKAIRQEFADNEEAAISEYQVKELNSMVAAMKKIRDIVG